MPEDRPLLRRARLEPELREVHDRHENFDSIAPERWPHVRAVMSRLAARRDA